LSTPPSKDQDGIVIDAGVLDRVENLPDAIIQLRDYIGV